MEKIDLVICYVDMSEKVWQESFLSRFSKTYLDLSRYRSWDLLKYIFRGIEKNLPFINNVYLVVSNIEQVPDWANKENVHIILHQDIIPQGLLPCFNSITIEFFLHRIKGLSEHFIYFNDDFFVLNPVNSDQLFREDKPCIRINKYEIDNLIFNRILKKVNDIVFNKIPCPLELKDNEYLRVPHGPICWLKSCCEQVLNIFDDEIRKSLYPVRNYNKDLSPLIFSLYQYVIGKTVNDYPTLLYIDGATNINYEKIFKINNLQYLCINDEFWTIENFNKAKEEFKKLFELKFPEKSKYEK